MIQDGNVQPDPREVEDGLLSPAWSQDYVYRAEGKALVPDPHEHPVLRRIQALHGQGASLRSIAATLTAEGHRPKRAGRWHTESLRQIVARG